jgi:NitT/TauT family transport system ATP-binding protein
MALTSAVEPIAAPGASAPASAAAVSFASVGKRFAGRREAGTATTAAVQNIDLEVRPGEFVAVVGPSGCGKSTLLRMAAGLDEPTTGSVRVGGAAGADGTGRAAPSIGFLFQEPRLMPWLSVRDNVALALRLGGRRARRDRRGATGEVDRALEAVGLAGFDRHLPHMLSGGMRMRVALARSLIRRPDVLLLDEPFGALDEMTRQEMQTELLRLHAEHRFTALFVTHGVAEAVHLAQRVVVMTARPGRIAAVVEVDLPHPRTPEHRFDPRATRCAARVSALLRGD